MTLSGIQTSDTFWDVYRALLAAFEGLSQDPELDLTLATHFETSRSIAEDGMAILPGLKELRTGICIVCSRGEKYRYAGGAEQPPLPISWALQRESKPEDGPTIRPRRPPGDIEMLGRQPFAGAGHADIF